MESKVNNGQPFEILENKQWECNSISLGFMKTRFSNHDPFFSQNKKDTVRLHIGLSGDYAFSFKNINKRFDLIGGHHNLLYSNGIELEIEAKSKEIDTFGIDFPKSFLIQYLDDEDLYLRTFCKAIIEGKSSLYSPKWGSVNTEIQLIIDQIRNNQYHGSIQQLFLVAKSMELLVQCIESYKYANALNRKFIKTKEDKQKIMYARDYINEHFKDPPTLTELSSIVSINAFKLKNGFKEEFGSTVFNYIDDKRLQYAKQLIMDSGKSISEIAYELGFSSPQHFSSRFKNKFGQSPNSIRKNP